jgi:hypothetical protein
VGRLAIALTLCVDDYGAGSSDRAMILAFNCESSWHARIKRLDLLIDNSL